MTSKRQSRFSVIRNWLRGLVPAFLCLAALGCATPGGGKVRHAGIDAKEHAQGVGAAEEGKEAAEVGEKADSADRPEIRWSHKLNPIWWIGNADDPEPPDWYRPGRRCRRVRWHLRNPFHNFTFYVIGIADKDFERAGTHPGRVFHPEGGWTRAVSRHRCWRLPFVSYIRGDFKFYIGWRERGNFGVKLTF